MAGLPWTGTANRKVFFFVDNAVNNAGAFAWADGFCSNETHEVIRSFAYANGHYQRHGTNARWSH